MKRKSLKLITIPVGLGAVAVISRLINKEGNKIGKGRKSKVENQLRYEDMELEDILKEFNRMTTLQREQAFSDTKREVVITDKVKDISILKEPCILLGDYTEKSNKEGSILCIFEDSDRDKLLRLDRNEEVTLKGTLSTEGNVLSLISCEIVSKETS